MFVRGVRARVRVFLTAGRVAGGREETLIECGAAGAGGGGGAGRGLSVSDADLVSAFAQSAVALPK